MPPLISAHGDRGREVMRAMRRGESMAWHDKSVGGGHFRVQCALPLHRFSSSFSLLTTQGPRVPCRPGVTFFFIFESHKYTCGAHLNRIPSRYDCAVAFSSTCRA